MQVPPLRQGFSLQSLTSIKIDEYLDLSKSNQYLCKEIQREGEGEQALQFCCECNAFAMGFLIIIFFFIIISCKKKSILRFKFVYLFICNLYSLSWQYAPVKPRSHAQVKPPSGLLMHMPCFPHTLEEMSCTPPVSVWLDCRAMVQLSITEIDHITCLPVMS